MSESTDSKFEKKPTTLKGWLIRGGGITAILTAVGFVGQQSWEAYDAKISNMEARFESFENQKTELEKVKLRSASAKEASERQNAFLTERLDGLVEAHEREEKVIWETLTQQNDKIRDSEIKVGVMEKIMEQDRLVRILQAAPPALALKVPTKISAYTKKDLEKIMDEVKKSKKSTDSGNYRNIQQKKWSSKNGPSPEQMQQKK